jgi:hypothetical protein
MAVLFYLSEKYWFSSVPYQKLCVFASLADEAKGGDGAKSAWREIFRPVLVNRRLVSGRL